jgi:methylmalonyl-CoA mutase N-terminal domain/subunit
MDEALSLPTQEAVQIALRTQQILAEESGVANTIDPLGGSYLVESLTDEIESRAREYIAEIDRLGGALPAIEKGYIQGEIQESAYRQQMDLESGAAHQVGVNIYEMDEDLSLDLLTVNPVQEKAQLERLARLRAERDSGRVEELKVKLESTAEGDDNLMPVLVECVEAYLTLGEITGTLRGVWGEYRPAGLF